MLIDALANVIEKSGCLEEFWGRLDSGDDATLAVASSARPLLVSACFAHNPKSTLVVVSGEDAAVLFARNCAAYLGDDKVLRFPERRDYPFNPTAPDVKTVARRMEAAWALQSGEKVVVVASARSLTRNMPPAEHEVARPLVLLQGHELGDMGLPDVDEMGSFVRTLERKGYQNTGELDGPGTFAVRGGTIDVFPANLVYPVRLDFFGDELEEIRRIVPSTGQTISSLEKVEIYPVNEFEITDKTLKAAKKALEKPAKTNKQLRAILEELGGGLRFDGSDVLLPYIYGTTVTLGDYAGESTLITLIEPRAIMDDAQRAFEEAQARASDASMQIEGLYTPATALDFGSGQHAVYVSIMRAGGSVDDELPVKRVDVAGGEDRLFDRLGGWVENGFTCVFSIPNHRAREDMKLRLVEHGLPIHDMANVEEDDAGKLKRRSVNIVSAAIPMGFVIPKAKLTLVSISDLSGSRKTTQRTAKTIDVTEITFPYAPGDYVVHAVFGVALFAGLTRREIDGSERDYLELQYAEGDKLYLPVEQLDRVTRYVGPEGASPRLTRLNSTDWSRAMAKARKATKKLAFDLVDVYSRRAAAKGYRFQVDTPWMRQMADSFPFDETPDQAAAIADVLADMASDKPMDRLICGDVGFGKTEVALRAAFAAAENGKQVMVLCPTTILAQQHFTTFSERLQPFKIDVEVLSRFRSNAQQAETLERFSKGECQVLIGTHRLLSRDVNPHDLGLVIIDEEQRFGVGHKEQLKNMRESVDVLTLSATPIPRTMQMATSGVRDMSLILTPPDERLPVKVHVGEWDPDVVSEAIRFELARRGQVYYVSNRVRTIEDAVERVREAAPEARIGVAHGKMTKDQLEHVMEDFSAGEVDVLVATTIIESGIDNPHTNTLIIEDSQRLGLAQMYQLKGRVGRSNVQAYAYFMFPEEIPLTDEAQARLLALGEHQDLGSGMRIALRDLEIRGAGELLGAEQHGNMSAVGFDLFAQMLNQAVIAAREGDESSDALPPALSDIIVNVPGHTYLPEEYIPDADIRVYWYRRIANAGTLEDVDKIEQQLLEALPQAPDAARNLFAKARLKAFANEHGVKTISVANGNLTVEPVSLDRSQLINIKRRGGRYVKEKQKLVVPMRSLKTDKEDSTLHAVSSFVQELYNSEAEDSQD